VRIINNSSTGGGKSLRKHSLQPLIKTKPRSFLAKNPNAFGQDNNGKTSRGILSPYRDKPELAERIMKKTTSKRLNKFGSTVGNARQVVNEAQFQEDLSPSRTYFPSHMSQTLNSIRRLPKGIYEKNQQLYSQEEQVKALMRKIK